MKIELNVPLSQKVAQALRAMIRREYGGGGRIPGEIELADQFGVSRGTVRQALSILEREGVIHKQQGSGTYANPYVLRIDARAETAYEFTDLIRRTGHDAGIELMGYKVVPADEELVTHLELSVGSPTLVVDKLFKADSQPAIFCSDMIPVGLIQESYDDSDLHVPIFDFIEKHCGLKINYILAEIVPITSTSEIASTLGMKVSHPLLQFVEVGYTKKNKPVMYSKIYYKDSIVRFSVLRKKV